MPADIIARKRIFKLVEEWFWNDEWETQSDAEMLDEIIRLTLDLRKKLRIFR